MFEIGLLKRPLHKKEFEATTLSRVKYPYEHRARLFAYQCFVYFLSKSNVLLRENPVSGTKLAYLLFQSVKIIDNDSNEQVQYEE